MADIPAKIRRNGTGRIVEVLVPTGSAAADSDVATFLSTDSASRSAADARYGRKGEPIFNLNDYATAGAAVDQSAGVQECFDAASSAGGTVVGRGTFRIQAQVRLLAAARLDNVRFDYYGTGNALVVGSDTAVTFRTTYRLPKVVYANSNNWDGTSVGVTLVNLNTCDVYVPWIESFDTNLLCIGKGTGIVYCTITLGHITGARRLIILTQNDTGWCNSNTFIGGRLQQSGARGGYANNPDATMISLLHPSTAAPSGPNGNTFVGTSIEGENWAQYRVTLDQARYNSFVNCRWEVNGSTELRVRYLNGSSDNRIDGGYDAGKITEEFDSTSTGGVISDNTAGTSGGIPSAQAIPTSAFTNVDWSAAAAKRITYDSATQTFTPRPGRWLITAHVTFVANGTGVRRLALYIPGYGTRKLVEVTPSASGKATLQITEVFKFTATAGTFQLQAYQSSGADLALDTTGGACRISAEYLSA